MRRTILVTALSIVMLGAVCHRHDDFNDTTGVLRGIVIDAISQDPIVGASVSLKGTTLGALTDISGKFKFTHISPGSVSLVVATVGYVRVDTGLVVQPNTVTNCSVALEAAVLDTAIVIHTYCGPYGRMVSGIVTDSLTGKPIAGVQVKTSFLNKKAITDSTGIFRINAPFQGEYELKFSHKKYYTLRLKNFTTADTVTHAVLLKSKSK